MSKVDFKKELKHLYRPSAKDFTTVDVPRMHFLMIDGHGDPNVAQAYQEALAALYAVAYKIKFASKQALGRDYVVPPLEGLWWAEDMSTFTAARDKRAWDWTMMIMTPDWITAEMVEEAIEIAGAKKELSALAQLRFETYDEGLSVQILHVGPYDAEGPTLARLHQTWLPANDYVEDGKHHEIYLSDPRRTAPDRMKTVLRQPIRRAKVAG
jgi:hypothetical protein